MCGSVILSVRTTLLEVAQQLKKVARSSISSGARLDQFGHQVSPILCRSWERASSSVSPRMARCDGITTEVFAYAAFCGASCQVVSWGKDLKSGCLGLGPEHSHNNTNYTGR